MSMSAEKELIALRLAMDGKSITDIIKAVDMLHTAFYDYQEHNPKFQDKFKRARRLGLEKLADDLVTIPDTYEDANRARLKSDNLKWLLGKRIPQTYGDRVELNVSQTVDIGGALAEALIRSRDVTPPVAEIEATASTEREPIDIKGNTDIDIFD